MRIYLLILLCLLPVVEIFAQKFEAQIQVGVNASQIDGDVLLGYNKPGLLIGPIVSFPFTDIFALQTGMLYSQKGSRSTQEQPFFIQRLNYIEMPLAARFHAFEQLDFVAGITANYLINAKADDGRGFSDNRNPDPQNPNTGFKDFDFCYMAAVNYVPFERTTFQVRLVNGFFNAHQSAYQRNRSLSFSVLFCLLKP